MGTHTIFTSKVCYIERDDFREEDLPGYRRLSPSNVSIFFGCFVVVIVILSVLYREG